MARAAMPEATVNEYEDAFARERKVGTPEQAQVSPPSRDSVLSEQRDHSQLRNGIPATPYVGHHLGALLSGEGVDHRSYQVLPLAFL